MGLSPVGPVILPGQADTHSGGCVGEKKDYLEEASTAWLLQESLTGNAI